MNANTFRLIFSKRLGMCVPVAEQRSAQGKTASEKAAGRVLTPLAFSLTLLCAAPALALPVAPTVAHGGASFSQSGSTLTVINTPNAIINWGSFSIGQNELTKFVQQSSASAVLNRVTGQNPSQILGQLQSNGRVFLINPNGIVFGQGARIDTAGLIASTLNLSDADFLAGKLKFSGTGSEGKVDNQGTINTAQGGFVYLIAPHVENSGLINAPNGDVLLAAGHSVEIADGLNPALRVVLTAPEGQVTNLGQILAESGRIGLHGGMVANSGTVSASSAVAEGGKIYLRATGTLSNETTAQITASGTQGGTVVIEAGFAALGGDIAANGVSGGGAVTIRADQLSHAGNLEAKGGAGSGGQVLIDVKELALQNVFSTIDVGGASGGTIRLLAGQQISSSGNYLATGSAGAGGAIELSAPATKLLSAKIDASGAYGGGTIRIGGEYQGGKNLLQNELPNAETLAVSAGTTIKADATVNGNGGTVILWSDINSALFPSVSAAPAQAGAGGFIELSSAETLNWGGSATAGLGGTVLFDPKNIIIQDASTNNVQYNLVMGFNYIDLPRMRGDASNSGNPGDFGYSVSLYGTQLAVGTASSNSVYLFNNPFSTPTLSGVIAKGYTGLGNYNLTALEAGDQFGYSVSLYGSKLAVGAPGDKGPGNVAQYDLGAVYLLNDPFGSISLSGIIGSGYTGSGNSSVATSASLLFQVGSSVSLYGNQLAIGVPGEVAPGGTVSSAGAVYLFDVFGASPTQAGIIGYGHTGTGNLDMSSQLEALDAFGWSVALYGTKLAVGASRDDGTGNAANASGAVYIINNPFNSPTLSQTIGLGTGFTTNLASLEAGDTFGSSLSLFDTQLVIGASGDDGFANASAQSGAVYLFSNPAGSGYSQVGILGKGYLNGGNLNVTTLRDGDQFGAAVSLYSTTLAVGAPKDDGPANIALSDRGAVYLINTPFTTPSVSGRIGFGYTGAGSFNIGNAADGEFGSAVSLSGNQLVVGALNDGGNSGLAYLFLNPYSTPSLSGLIGRGYTGAGNFNVTNLESGDYFGSAVSLSGSQLAVGAYRDDGFANGASNSGAVYLFNNPYGLISQQGIIGKGYTGTGNLDLTMLADSDNFGYSVSLSGTQLAAGAVGDDGATNATSNSGAAYLISNPFSAPSVGRIIGKGYSSGFDLSALEAGDAFGSGVSLAGTQLAVGAYGDDGSGNSFIESGAVYLFNDPLSSISLYGTIGKNYTGTGNFSVANVGSGDYFGHAVSLNGTKLAIGAPQDDGFGNSATNSGAVYVVDNPFGGTALTSIVGKGYSGTSDYNLAALEANDWLGYAVALDGTRLAAGAIYDQGYLNVANNSGAVYLLTLTSAGTGTIGGAGFGTDSTLDYTLTPTAITDILSTGSQVVLQAENDITLSRAILSNNPAGNGGNLTLQAGRSILLNANITTDNGNLTLSANDALASSSDRDAGVGNINVASGVVINTGTGALSAAIGNGVTGGTANVGAFTNAGTISIGSTSSISSVFNNTGVFNITNGTLSLLAGATNSGTFNLAGTGSIRLPFSGNAYPTFANAAAGTLNINTTTGGWSFVSDSGTQGGIVNNAGTININTAYTSWEAAFTNNSTGMLNIAAGNALSMQNGQTLQGNITLGAGSTLWVSERHGTNAWFNGTTISGTGTVQVAAGSEPVADFTNVSASAATLRVANGGIANILAGTTTFGNLNMTGGTLTGDGTLNVNTSLSQTGGTQSGNGSTVLGSSATTSLGSANLSRALTNQGTLTLSQTTFSGSLENSGTLNVSTGTNTVLGAFTQSGILDVASGANFTKIGGFTNTGTIRGKGTIDVGSTGLLTNNGSVRPGASPGTLNITGNFTQGPSGTLFMELGGTSQGVNYDWLNITGSASLGGTLQVALFGGFAPVAGNAFGLINAAGGVSGTFAQINTPAGYNFSSSYGANLFNLNLISVAAPPTMNAVPNVLDSLLNLGAVSFETPLLYLAGQSSPTASSSGTLTQTAEIVLPDLMPQAPAAGDRGDDGNNGAAVTSLIPLFDQLVRDASFKDTPHDSRLICR